MVTAFFLGLLVVTILVVACTASLLLAASIQGKWVKWQERTSREDTLQAAIERINGDPSHSYFPVEHFAILALHLALLTGTALYDLEKVSWDKIRQCVNFYAHGAYFIPLPQKRALQYKTPLWAIELRVECLPDDMLIAVRTLCVTPQRGSNPYEQANWKFIGDIAYNEMRKRSLAPIVAIYG